MSGFGEVKIYRPDCKGRLVLAKTVSVKKISDIYFKSLKARSKSFSGKRKAGFSK